MTDVLVVAEHRDGAIRSVTHEAISAATELATNSVALALIAPSPDPLVESVSMAPVDTVYTVSHDEPFNHDVYRQVVVKLAKELDPTFIIAGNTVNGLDYLPAVANELDWPLVTDAIGFDRRDPDVLVTREAYGSKVETTVAIEHPPGVLSVRPGEWEAATESSQPTVEPAPVTIDEAAIRSTVLGIEAAAESDIDITEAEVVISIGRGIGEEDNLELIEELANVLDGTLAASRPIVDAGWLPKGRQVGQSGKTVTPKVYLAIGISGAVQHVAGMKDADTIISINNDPDAPIFDIADVGIVDDLFEVIPALIDAFGS